MKQLLYILVLLPVLALAQPVPIGNVPEPATNNTVNFGRRSDGVFMERRKGQAATPVKIDAKTSSLPIYSTISGLRSTTTITANMPEIVNVIDARMGGMFVRKAGDNTTLNDDVVNIRTANGDLYTRLFDGRVNVRWFGAKGDGTVDDGPAIQAGLNYIVKHNYDLFMGDSLYKTGQKLLMLVKPSSTALVFGGRRPSISGAGMEQTTIEYTGSTPVAILKVVGSNSADDGIKISDLKIRASNPNVRKDTALALNRSANHTINKVHLTGVKLGLDYSDANEGSFNYCVFDFNSEGAYGINATYAIAPNANLFFNCAFNSNLKSALVNINGCNTEIANCRFLGNGSQAHVDSAVIYLQFAGFSGGGIGSIHNNYLEGNRGVTLIRVRAAEAGGISITDNTFNRMGLDSLRNDIRFDAIGSMTTIGAGETRKIHIKLSLNTFNGYNGYTPKSTKKRVVFDGGFGAFNGFLLEENDVYSGTVLTTLGVTTNNLIEKTDFYTAYGVTLKYVESVPYNTFVTSTTGNIASLSATVFSLSASSGTAVAGKLNISDTTAFVRKLSGSRLLTSAEQTKLSNLSGTNSGDQDLSGLLVKSSNLSDLTNAGTARTNLGLGTMATQNAGGVAIFGGTVSNVLGSSTTFTNGIFQGTLSGTFSGTATGQFSGTATGLFSGSASLSTLTVSSTATGSTPFPAMTAAQRGAISSPTTGMMVYQTDGVTGVWSYNGAVWVSSAGAKLKVIASGDGSTTTFTASHGLGYTPTFLLFAAGSTDADQRNFKYVSADATTISVVYATAPLTGTNNLTFYLEAR